MPIPDKPDLSRSERYFAESPPPPEEYPTDTTLSAYYADHPSKTFAARRQWFLDHWSGKAAPVTVKGAYAELARLATGRGPVHEPLLLHLATFVEQRYDCADFTIHLLLRILLQYAESPLLSPAVIGRIREVVLGFKYGPWEPGEDSMCSWTENHQILFASAEYLAGDLFGNQVFTNTGETGVTKRASARKRVERWLELRYLTGFSEWLSHVYYDEDITALLSLADFAPDPIIATRARMILDLLLIDVAANSLHGAFGSTHGRSYPREKRFADTEATSDLSLIAFGSGRTTGCDAMGAFALAVSISYEPPPIAAQIVREVGPAATVSRQRMGFAVRDSRKWGIDPRREADAFMLLTQEAYLHPQTATAFVGLLERYRWWSNEFFSPIAPFRGLLRALRAVRLLPLLAWLLRKDATRNTREAVSLITRRTGNTMLSAALDYRPGFGGDQQHIWQATLGPRAVVFVNHPGSEAHGSAGYWVGEGTLPRVAIHGRCLIALYRPSHAPGLYKTNELFFTHAWFPTHEFDEVRRAGHWFFARKRAGYVALASRNPARWGGQTPDSEIVAEAGPNVWLCRVGSEAEDDSFDWFVERCATSSVTWSLRRGGPGVRWRIHGESELTFGWRGPLRVDAEPVALEVERRYESPWATVEFGARRMSFVAGEHRLELDYDRCERRVGRA